MIQLRFRVGGVIVVDVIRHDLLRDNMQRSIKASVIKSCTVQLKSEMYSVGESGE